MGFSFQGLSSNVTISGAVATGYPQPTTGQEVISFSATANGSSQDAYTVTAGKSFALFNITFQGGTAGNLNVYKNDGTSLVACPCTGTTGTGTINVGSSICASVPFHIYTAGQKVKVTGSNGCVYALSGVEYTP